MSNLSSNASSASNAKELACSAPIETEFIFHSIFLSLILVVTFIGNLLVLLAVIFFRRLRSITNYFIFSLAVSDFLIAVLSLPLRLDQYVHNAHWCRGLELCQMWILVDTIPTFASMWNLAVISIDRAIAIKKPFHYRSIITHKVGFGMIAGVWIYAVVLGLSMLTNWTEPGKIKFTVRRECTSIDPYYFTIAASAMSFFLPLLIIIVMYGMVFEVALNQTKAMAALQVDIGQGGRTGRGGRRSSINLIREVKAAKTLAIVIGCFIVCWLPFYIIVLISIWNRKLLKVLSKVQLLALSSTFIYVLPALNSTMNPIIYALFNRDFRQAFKTLGKRLVGTRLGAVGYGGSMMSSVSGLNNTVDYYTTKKLASKATRFNDRESVSSENPLPKIQQQNMHSFNNDAGNNRQKTFDNNFRNLNTDTDSMETTLEDIKKTNKPSEGMTSQNGFVNKDQCSSKDVIEYDNKATENDERELARGNINVNVKLPPIQKNPSFSSTDDGSQPTIVRANTLPPIEANDRHNNDINTSNSTDEKPDDSPVIQERLCGPSKTNTQNTAL